MRVYGVMPVPHVQRLANSKPPTLHPINPISPKSPIRPRPYMPVRTKLDSPFQAPVSIQQQLFAHVLVLASRVFSRGLNN